MSKEFLIKCIRRAAEELVCSCVNATFDTINVNFGRRYSTHKCKLVNCTFGYDMRLRRNVSIAVLQCLHRA